MEFFTALKSFPLWIEIPFQLIAVALVGVAAVARTPEQQQARRIANGLLGALGAAVIAYSAIALARDWDGINRGELLLEFLLPLWLTPVALSFVYLLSVYAAHEATWKRLRIWNEQSLGKQSLAVLLRCNVRLGALRALKGQALPALARASGFADAWHAIGEAQRIQRDAVAAEAATRQRLIDNAGVEGVDDEGKQLDQHEFAETRKALDWLATCQMGQHRNNGGRYRSDMLEIVTPTFVHDGLPEDHGVQLHVRRDGQAWYATRQTISGWHFAIGASGGPPDQWYYDGPTAPSGYPDEKNWDHQIPDKRSQNWS